MSYAIVEASGHQHRVQKGERLKLDRLEGNVGDVITLGHVLLLGGEEGIRVGQPLVDGARVEATIIAHLRDKKIRVFKRRKRKGFHKTIGHRQNLTEIEITSIA